MAAFQDRGFAAFSLVSAADCSALDSYRSYLSVPSGWPSSGAGNTMEFTLFVQAPYFLPAGGGTSVIYLNGQMTSGATAASPDSMQDPNVVVEFHPN